MKIQRTETAPQVKQFTEKHAATHTQPYPPSGGGEVLEESDIG